MVIWELIPTCNNPMSIYTLCAFTIFISAFILFASIYIRYNTNEIRKIGDWVKYEIKKVEICIDGYDDYIEKTNAVISKIHLNLAVQGNSMQDLKEDLAEIKADIKTLLNRN